MKYDVTHKCGHTQTHELFGPGSDRERKLRWLSGAVCSDCHKAEREAETVRAAEAVGVELPKLEGSDKQVAWAEDLRSRWISEMTRVFAQGTTDEKARRIAVRMAALVGTAREWIDCRCDTKAILKARREDYERIVKEETGQN
jgi:hypothetical protein